MLLGCGQVHTPRQEALTNRPKNKTLDTIGVMLLISGVVIGMAVAWIRGLAMGLQIALLIFALVLVVIGLVLNRKFRMPDS